MMTSSTCAGGTLARLQRLGEGDGPELRGRHVRQGAEVLADRRADGGEEEGVGHETLLENKASGTIFINTRWRAAPSPNYSVAARLLPAYHMGNVGGPTCFAFSDRQRSCATAGRAANCSLPRASARSDCCLALAALPLRPASARPSRASCCSSTARPASSKPSTPSRTPRLEIRGELGAIRSSVPGCDVCELLPHTAAGDGQGHGHPLGDAPVSDPRRRLRHRPASRRSTCRWS